MGCNAHEFMDEDNPRAQGEANKKKALVWTYNWGFTTPSILQLLLQHAGMSWANGAVKQGWMRKTGMTSRERVRVLTLTEKGLAWVEQRSDQLLKYSELDPHRISPATIWHNLLAQKLTLHAARRGEIKSFMTERVLATKSAQGTKQPDVVWFSREGERIAVEVELTAKWDRKLDDFVGKTIAALSEGEDGQRPRFDRFEILTTSRAIARRYGEAFMPGTSLRVWRDTTKGAATLSHLTEVPDWVHQKVSFRMISDDGRILTGPDGTEPSSADRDAAAAD
jgi:hypothetical protein